MKSKKVFLLLNGEMPSIIPNLESYDLVCAIDGAYNHFKQIGIEPHLITGDFDSIDSIPEHIEVIKTPDQNYTDFDKALTILIGRGFTHIEVYGGSGKEHDHFLGNISTALQWKGRLNISFYDDFGSYFFIEDSIQLSKVKNKTISLIPFPIAHNINTRGLLYSLSKETLTFGERIGTRNKAAENEVQISFKGGDLLVYISNK